MKTSNADQILVEVTDHILQISINRPNKKNALTQDMYAALSNAFEDATHNEDIRAVLITGGHDFSAGNDLEDFLQHPTKLLTSPLGDFIQALSNCTKPVIAAVDGYAVGIGTTLLLHCDLVYCSDRSTFILPFIDLGLVPEFGSSLLLPRYAGNHLAAELLMLGEPFGGEVALRAGLINGIIETKNLLSHAKNIAIKLAKKPANAMQQTKALLRKNEESLQDRIAHEASIFNKLVTSPEATSAMQAILDKGK